MDADRDGHVRGCHWGRRQLRNCSPRWPANADSTALTRIRFRKEDQNLNPKRIQIPKEVRATKRAGERRKVRYRGERHRTTTPASREIPTPSRHPIAAQVLDVAAVDNECDPGARSRIRG